MNKIGSTGHKMHFKQLWAIGHSVDGYELFGSRDDARVGERTSQAFESGAGFAALATDELLGALFFMCRAWRHQGCTPDGDEREYAEAIAAEVVERRGPEWFARVAPSTNEPEVVLPSISGASVVLPDLREGKHR